MISTTPRCPRPDLRRNPLTVMIPIHPHLEDLVSSMVNRAFFMLPACCTRCQVLHWALDKTLTRIDEKTQDTKSASQSVAGKHVDILLKNT